MSCCRGTVLVLRLGPLLKPTSRLQRLRRRLPLTAMSDETGILDKGNGALV